MGCGLCPLRDIKVAQPPAQVRCASASLPGARHDSSGDGRRQKCGIESGNGVGALGKSVTDESMLIIPRIYLKLAALFFLRLLLKFAVPCLFFFWRVAVARMRKFSKL